MAPKLRKTSVHEVPKKNCGKKILSLRLGLKISQAELAKRVGASAMSICKWEAGANRPLANDLTKFGFLQSRRMAVFLGPSRINGGGHAAGIVPIQGAGL